MAEDKQDPAKSEPAKSTTADEDAKAAQTKREAAAKDASGKDKPPFVIHGVAGGPFSIDGSGFGGSGSVSISGRQLQTTRWRDDNIKGVLPADIEAGDVVVKGALGELKGQFPSPPPAQVTTTVTTTTGPAAPGTQTGPQQQTAPKPVK